MRDESSGLLAGTRRELLRRVAVAQAEGRAPSLVAGVVRGGELVWSGVRSSVPGHAPTADVQYRIGSLTKTFVGVLVLRLREDGLVGLEDPVGKHVAGLPEGVAELTLAQLLSHTAGLAAETPGPWWERTDGGLRPELVDVLAEPAVRHPAGRLFHYSNVGFAVLGAVVEAVRGERWDAVLEAEVLEPLGMRRTGVQPQAPHAGGWAVHPWADVLLPEPLTETGRMAPAGQLWSTVEDLGRWAAFLMRGDERILSAEVLEEMRAPVAPPAGEWGDSYGLGLQLMRRQGKVLVGHGGSMPGFVAGLWCDLEEDVAGVALANSTAGVAVGGLAVELAELVAEREPRIPEPWQPVEEADEQLLGLTGSWYWGPAAFVLRLRAGGGSARGYLELAPVAGGGARASRFRARGNGSWTGLDGYFTGETLRAVRGADGAVSHLDLGSFVLTREPYPAEAAEVVPGGVDSEGWRGV